MYHLDKKNERTPRQTGFGRPFAANSLSPWGLEPAWLSAGDAIRFVGQDVQPHEPEDIPRAYLATQVVARSASEVVAS
jgi:hypothetical protein